MRQGLSVVLAELTGVISLVEQRRQVLPFLGTDKAKTALFELAIEGAVDQLPKPTHESVAPVFDKLLELELKKHKESLRSTAASGSNNNNRGRNRTRTRANRGRGEASSSSKAE